MANNWFAELAPEHQQIVAVVMNAHGICSVIEKVCICSECRRDWKTCDKRIELTDWLSRGSGERANV